MKYEILHEFKREINSNNLSMQELINPNCIYTCASATGKRGYPRISCKRG